MSEGGIELPLGKCPGPDCQQPEEVQSDQPPVGGVVNPTTPDDVPPEPDHVEEPWPEPAPEPEPQADV